MPSTDSHKLSNVYSYYYEKNSLRNSNEYVYYSYMDDIIIFYFNISNISSLPTIPDSLHSYIVISLIM